MTFDMLMRVKVYITNMENNNMVVMNKWINILGEKNTALVYVNTPITKWAKSYLHHFEEW